VIGLEFTSQKSFSCSGSQTLFSAEPVTEKIRLRSQTTYVQKKRTYVTFKTEMECGTSFACKALESHVGATVGDHAVLCVL